MLSRSWLPLTLLALLALAACNAPTPKPAALPPGVSPLPPTATATATPARTPTPTPDLAATAQATLAALTWQQQQLHLTATAVAFQAQQAARQMTRVAARQTAALQGTQQALAFQATATLQALAVAQTIRQATQTAQRTATAAAWQSVLAAQALQATRTAQQADWDAAQQARLRRNLLAWGGTAALLLLMLGGATLALWLLYRRLGLIVLRPEPNGDAPLVVLPDGSVYDPDRNPFPLLPATRRSAAWLAHLPLDLLQTVLQRDQATDLTRSAPRRFRSFAPLEADAPPFRIVAPGQRPALLDSDTLAVLEAEWREAHETP